MQSLHVIVSGTSTLISQRCSYAAIHDTFILREAYLWRKESFCFSIIRVVVEFEFASCQLPFMNASKRILCQYISTSPSTPLPSRIGKSSTFVSAEFFRIVN